MTEARGPRDVEGALYWPQLRRDQFERLHQERAVVVVPVGSIEQHGPHCPVDVDLANALEIALEASRRATDFPLVVGQELPFGFTHYNEGFPGTVTLQLETFIAVVTDIGRGIHGNGFERIIFLNGHGGNHHPLKAISVKLAEHDVYTLAFSHWDLLRDELVAWGDRDTGIGHAGEWETSLQLFLRPQLVDRARQVAESWEPSVDPRFAGFAVFPERRRETPLGVMGDPTVATAEKGGRYVAAAAERLVELARAFRAQPVRHYRHAEGQDSSV
jgi:creatinine amidohydrolase